MGILDIFSKRNRKDMDPIFKYDDFPKEFRVQVIHIWSDAIGAEPYSESMRLWAQIHKLLCKEYGVFELSDRGGDNPFIKCQYFILNELKIERVLDIIELTFRVIDVAIRELEYKWREMGVVQTPDDAILELNQRFREHGLGYQYVKGNIVRVDSAYIYREAVEPAIQRLFDEGFEGASDEFMKAHEHFRKGNDKEAIIEAMKAFESVMKTILVRKKWSYDGRDTASKLINALFENGIVDKSLQTHLTSLKTTLEGLSTIRNRTSGHGQGEKKKEVPRHLVAYALHLCATNILFLIDCYKASK